ncbi:MAG: VWA domain-containing protein [Candidatus Promineifilaceae bacterium]|jgi:Ca-activated chloride channel family protein
MNLEERNYYELLELDHDATTADIESAYLHVLALHKQGDNQTNPVEVEHIRRAYEVLRDPKRRDWYDALLTEVSKPFDLNLQVSSRQLPILDEQQMVYLLAELLPPDENEQMLLPLNLCLVIDRSTSMRGERLQRIKNALELLLPQFSSRDMLSVVAFSDRAEVLLPSQLIGEREKTTNWIDRIEASGGTEIYQGLLSGVKQLRKVSLEDYNNQLILLTDGRTYGDEAECLKLARDAASSNISIHAFGIGSDWDDKFLDALVAPSNGLVEYIDSAEKIVSSLQKRLRGLGETYARQVNLLADWPQMVELVDSFRLTPYAQQLQPNGESIVLGDIEGGGALSFLLAFSVKPQPIATRIRIPLTISAELPDTGMQTLKEQLELSLTPDPPAINPPPDVTRAVRLMTLYHLHELAWQEAEAGKTDRAVMRMRRLSTRLLEAGETDLANQADFEARQLGLTGRLSPLGHKSLKYGTRALTRKTIQLGWDD